MTNFCKPVWHTGEETSYVIVNYFLSINTHVAANNSSLLSCSSGRRIVVDLDVEETTHGARGEISFRYRRTCVFRCTKQVSGKQTTSVKARRRRREAKSVQFPLASNLLLYVTMLSPSGKRLNLLTIHDLSSPLRHRAADSCYPFFFR